MATGVGVGDAPPPYSAMATDGPSPAEDLNIPKGPLPCKICLKDNTKFERQIRTCVCCKVLCIHKVMTSDYIILSILSQQVKLYVMIGMWICCTISVSSLFVRSGSLYSRPGVQSSY